MLIYQYIFGPIFEKEGTESFLDISSLLEITTAKLRTEKRRTIAKDTTNITNLWTTWPKFESMERNKILSHTANNHQDFTCLHFFVFLDRSLYRTRRKLSRFFCVWWRKRKKTYATVWSTDRSETKTAKEEVTVGSHLINSTTCRSPPSPGWCVRASPSPSPGGRRISPHIMARKPIRYPRKTVQN